MKPPESYPKAGPPRAARSRMNTRAPRHDTPPNHRRISVPKRRSTDLVELYVFGREREATVVERNLELTNDGGRVRGARGRLGSGSGPGPGTMTRRRGRSARLRRRRARAWVRGEELYAASCIAYAVAAGNPRLCGSAVGRGPRPIRTGTGRGWRHRRQGPFAHAAVGRAGAVLSTSGVHRTAIRCTGGTRLVARAG